MRPQFSLFQTPIDLAHSWWANFLKKGDIAIDATCGNGQDTLFLAQCVLTEESGAVYALDIQYTALEKTKALLMEHLPPQTCQRVHFLRQCHSTFPSIAKESVRLIVYNLGYLPGGNKSLTTMLTTTLRSVQEGLQFLMPGGLMSLTCYPGHVEGKSEETGLVEWVRQLDPKMWNCTHHRWLNRSAAPSLILIQKSA